jgi:hypothetical protein
MQVIPPAEMTVDSNYLVAARTRALNALAFSV